ncbi:hypothetical protein BKA62DRAFT_783129 [Auriculariales sp. MPI-PUGE-AT-0066]|nr:hypothetical protein BKA62DRAFT_783129 [Auriculariales sp. MPI-PUGE-AT-0066]
MERQQSYTVGFTNGLAMDSNWATTNTGTTVASQGISGGTIWLRITANIAPSSDKVATFYYSTTGESSGFVSLGTYTMTTDWQFFMGYRFAVFNDATLTMGGFVTVPYFDLGALTLGQAPAALLKNETFCARERQHRTSTLPVLYNPPNPG